VAIGGQTVQVIAGPCSVETADQMNAAADAVPRRRRAADAWRRVQAAHVAVRVPGQGRRRLKLLRDAAARHGLPVVTELMDARMLDAFLEHGVDVIQIGTRNMQNFDLLKAVGRVTTPVILKRGMSATVAEWLMAAEYIPPRQPQHHLLRARHPHLRNGLPQRCST